MGFCLIFQGVGVIGRKRGSEGAKGLNSGEFGKVRIQN